ncbi:MAG: hypothetical protein G8237_06770 [Magnetococcales bacterium]|nr:hypothetical protein [Magnetococcales bacterium]NGZ06043.1 hypothetical protein [Magnetococcales bacterium]
MLTLNRFHEWFCGPGDYFWASDSRLVDVHLGFCATTRELEAAIQERIGTGRELLEMGGSAYRTRHAIAPPLMPWRAPAIPTPNRYHPVV